MGRLERDATTAGASAGRATDASCPGFLRGLFPAGVVPALAVPAMWEEPELPEEEVFVRKAVEKRQREFRAGRACARTVLSALGGPRVAIPVGPRRAPVWPPGFVGSITHTRDLCAAAAARRERVRGLGLDAEQRRVVGRHLWRRLARPEEIRWLEAARSGLGSEPDEWATFLFSAKESLYKAIHDLVPVRLGFQDVRILPPSDDGRFRPELVGSAAAHRSLVGDVDARFTFVDRHVLTAVTLPVRHRR